MDRPIAFLVIGQPRLWREFEPVLEQLLEVGTAFLALSPLDSFDLGHWLEDERVVVVENDDVLCRCAKNLIARRGSGMLQWKRYQEALDAVLDYESRNPHQFHPIIKKLRSDYLYENPHLLKSTSRELGNWELLANTDMTFGGRREVMFALRGMFDAITHHYAYSRQNWVPLNPHQIRQSDNVTPWHWSRLPYRLLLRLPRKYNTDERQELKGVMEDEDVIGKRRRVSLSVARGNRVVSYELALAQKLNLLGIPARDDRQYHGSLSPERFQVTQALSGGASDELQVAYSRRSGRLLRRLGHLRQRSFRRYLGHRLLELVAPFFFRKL